MVQNLLLLLSIDADQAAAWRNFVDLLRTTHADRYARSRQRVGIVSETVWSWHTPRGEQGFLLVRHILPGLALYALAHSSDPFDQWFRQSLRALTGIDLGNGWNVGMLLPQHHWASAASAYLP